MKFRTRAIPDADGHSSLNTTENLASAPTPKWPAPWNLFLRLVLPALALAIGPGALFPPAQGPQPNLAGEMERPLRYRPDGPDFVIINGTEFFNRPLYGRNTAFRVDAGDKPEFSLYLPGRGGNLRLGVRSGGQSRWLVDAAHIVTRYRPGAMVYEIRDPLLGPEGLLHLQALALHTTDGLVVRVEGHGLAPEMELVWAYGGVTGERGIRDGDIGTERVPISEYFQLQPAFTQDNAFTLTARTFTLRSAAATIVGLAPAASRLAVAEATRWDSVADLLESTSGDITRPVVVGRAPLPAGKPLFLALQRVEAEAATAEELDTYRAVTTAPAAQAAPAATVEFLPAYAPEELPGVFAAAETHFDNLRRHVTVDTPDPFINAAVGALNIGADAVWDEPQGVVMHGAIAWRSRLLGWRGPYAMDALGWSDRARRHLAYWATRQNTSPIPDRLPPPEEETNLSRRRTALHSNGDMAGSHYDMNTVYIDALFRHLLWTGDVDFARELWPVIERHLAWQRRLFRREFGPERLPLYEGYAQIWASDDIQYHGGGTTYSSAYNQWHNRMAARLARLLGQDPTPYEREADLIGRALRAFLWLPDRGSFAEFKDLLGHQRVHPSAGLWSFYHTVDSHAVSPEEAWQMTLALDAFQPRLPVKGPGVPSDARYHVFSTTNWMPYTWSVNNVVMGENLHTALGYWQAGRPEEAFVLMKSALLASMYLGICPGNIGSMNYLDVYRRESQRDFADGSGVFARALVEGLFGVKPDALARVLQVIPGIPAAWGYAKLEHPVVDVAFVRHGLDEQWTIEAHDARFDTVRLRLPVAREQLETIEVGGQPVAWTPAADSVGRPWIALELPLKGVITVKLTWAGRPFEAWPTEGATAAGSGFERTQSGPFVWLQRHGLQPRRDPEPTVTETDWRLPTPPSVSHQPLALAPHFNDRVTAIFQPGKYRSPRSPHVSMEIPAQGIGAWAGHVHAMAEIDDTGLRAAAAAAGGRFLMPNGVPFLTPGEPGVPNVVFVSCWDNYPNEATVPLSGRANRVHLLLAGSTNHMQSRIDNGEVVVTYADGSTSRLRLHNPTTWWPIEQDYFIDDFQFRRPGPLPPRVDLRSGEVRLLDEQSFKGRGGAVPGGAATVLTLNLDPQKPLQSLTVRALSNEVVIGLMAATLEQ